METLRAAGGAGDGETGAFAATLVQQLSKHSKTVATGFFELKVVPLLVAHIAGGSGSPAPAASALGHICDASADAAAAAVASGAIGAIKGVLERMAPPPVCAALCSALGAISFAGESHANAIAASGAMQLMAEATILSGRRWAPPTTELARKGIAKAVNKCADYEVLTWLIEALPFTGGNAQHEVLAALLKAMGRLLANRGNYRLDFMQRGALTLCQQATKGTAELKEGLKALNVTCCRWSRPPIPTASPRCSRRSLRVPDAPCRRARVRRRRDSGPRRGVANRQREGERRSGERERERELARDRAVPLPPRSPDRNRLSRLDRTHSVVFMCCVETVSVTDQGLAQGTGLGRVWFHILVFKACVPRIFERLSIIE